MSRREILFVIAIVNIALLSILFITAERLEELPASRTEVAVTQQAQAELPQESPPYLAEVAVDEVDTFLSDFAATMPLLLQEPPVMETAQIDHIVKRGDFLEKIARSNSTTVEALKQLNNLTSDHLKIGQVLHIPRRLPAAPAEVKSPEGQLYCIKSGDNPWKIAKNFNMSVEDLLRLNDLDEGSARNLKPGHSIRIQ